MRKKWNQIETEFFTRRAMAALVLVMGIILIAPLLYLGKYNHMAGDCYWFAYWPHVCWQNTHNILLVIGSAWETVKNFYVNWQGTFTSIFFFALTPGVFGEQYFFIVPYLMIGMTFVSTFFLIYVICRKWLGFDLYSCFIVSGLIFLMQIEFMDAGTSGMFWYNASVHYVFMQGFAILCPAVGLLFLWQMKRPYSKGKNFLLLCMESIFAFMASGANFSTALLGGEFSVILAFVSLWLFYKKKKKTYLWQLLPMVVSLSGLIVNMAAPGNAVRQSYFEKQTPVMAIINSFITSSAKALEWTDLYVLGVMIVLVPILLKAAGKSVFSFSFPVVWVVLSYCLYASMFTPAFYALGDAPIDRNMNICQMFFYLILILDEIYLLGWSRKRLSFIKKWEPVYHKNVLSWVVILFLITAAIAVRFLLLDAGQKMQTANSYIAWRNIEEGSARQMWQEYLVRLNALKNDTGDILYVEEYRTKPPLLFVNSDTEIPVDDSRELNQQVARWYQKTAVYVMNSSEE